MPIIKTTLQAPWQKQMSKKIAYFSQITIFCLICYVLIATLCWFLNTKNDGVVDNFAVMWSFFSRDPTKDFAYEIGDKVSGLEDRSLWILHQGKRKVCG